MDGPRSSSPQGDEPASSSSPSLPFFNHNAATLPSNLPPRIDDKPLARQKRKRTSPEDQAVLEAFYARDPKPDKAARLELVKQVALGEKEVQIWFQNRRQSSRRKSRPLLPHEIAQYQLSRSAVAHENLPGGPDNSQSQAQRQSTHDYPATKPMGCAEQTGASRASEDLQRPVSPAEDLHASSQMLNPAVGMERGNLESSSPQTEYVTSFEGARADNAGLSRMGDQRNAPILYDGQLPGGVRLSHGHPQRAPSPKRARKMSSFVRLSMNSDGGAEIVAKDTSSPSPPRPSVSSQPMFGGNISAAADTKDYTAASQTPPVGNASKLKRASSGRSRDSRAWEFWCDRSAKSELEEKAEKDASGSAADAIQLLRSASGRSVLGSIPAKRNSTLPGLPGTSKRLRREGRGSLQRSSTTNGRMQGKQAGKTVPKLKDSKSALSVHIPGNDSDKENWSPNSDVHSDGHSLEGDEQRAGHCPHEGQSRPSAGFDKASAATHKETIDPENDPEIAAFMRAGWESDRVSDNEELDCVQGLLSLSQGNWR